MGSSAFTPASPVDVLVFAPHPDDEVIVREERPTRQVSSGRWFEWVAAAT